MLNKVLIGGIALGSVIIAYLLLRGKGAAIAAPNSPINVNVNAKAPAAIAPNPAAVKTPEPTPGKPSPSLPTTPKASNVLNPTKPNTEARDNYNQAVNGFNLAVKNIAAGVQGYQQLTAPAKLAPGQLPAGALAGGGSVAGAAAAVSDPRADAGYLAVKGAGGVVRETGQALVTVRTPEKVVTQATSPYQGPQYETLNNKAGNFLTKAGESITSFAGVGAIAGVIGFDAYGKGFKDANEKERNKILAGSAVQGAQAAAGVIPIVGAPISVLIGALAQTGEGQRVALAAGVGLNKGYEVQKEVVKSGNVVKAFNENIEGGASHKERQASFFTNIDARLGALAQGGTLTKADIEAINNGRAQGLVYTSSGFDLSKIGKSPDFVVGKNPIAKPAATAPAWEVFTSGQTALNKGYGQLYTSGSSLVVTGPYGPLAVRDATNVYQTVGEALSRGNGYLYQDGGKYYVTGPKGPIQIMAKIGNVATPGIPQQTATPGIVALPSTYVTAANPIAPRNAAGRVINPLDLKPSLRAVFDPSKPLGTTLWDSDTGAMVQDPRIG